MLSSQVVFGKVSCEISYNSTQRLNTVQPRYCYNSPSARISVILVFVTACLTLKFRTKLKIMLLISFFSYIMKAKTSQKYGNWSFGEHWLQVKRTATVSKIYLKCLFMTTKLPFQVNFTTKLPLTTFQSNEPTSCEIIGFT